MILVWTYLSRVLKLNATVTIEKKMLMLTCCFPLNTVHLMLMEMSLVLQIFGPNKIS